MSAQAVAQELGASKSGQVLNLILVVVLLVLFAAHWGVARDRNQRLGDYFTDMVRSPAYEAQQANSVTADGKNLRQTPAGTLPRGFRPFRYGVGNAEAKRAGRELKAPKLDAKAVARGQELYEITCTPCHSSSGLGGGTVVKRGFPPPPSLLAEQARAMADGELFHIITKGKGNMPSHAAQLFAKDRWMVIAYLRTLQKK